MVGGLSLGPTRGRFWVGDWLGRDGILVGLCLGIFSIRCQDLEAMTRHPASLPCTLDQLWRTAAGGKWELQDIPTRTT